MKAKLQKLILFLRLNSGLIKKMAYYVGIPAIIFMVAVVFIVKFGGISSYTLDTHHSNNGTVLMSLKPNIANIIMGALFFVVLPVVVSLVAISRKSMSFKAAALVVNFIAVILMTISVNPSGSVGCGMGSRSGGYRVSAAAGSGSEWEVNAEEYCDPTDCSQCVECKDACMACASSGDSNTCQNFWNCYGKHDGSGSCTVTGKCPTGDQPAGFNPDCQASNDLQELLANIEGPITPEIQSQIADLSSKVATCPLASVGLDKAVKDICGNIETQLQKIAIDSSLFPVRAGLKLGDLDEQAIDSSGNATVVPSFKLYFPVLTDNGLKWWTYLGVGIAAAVVGGLVGSIGGGLAIIVAAAVVGGGTGSGGTAIVNAIMQHSKEVNIGGSNYYIAKASAEDGKGMIITANTVDASSMDGQFVVACSTEALTGVNMTVSNKGLAYAVAVFKPWMRDDAQCSSEIPTSYNASTGVGDLFGMVASNNCVGPNTLDSCKTNWTPKTLPPKSRYMNCSKVQSLAGKHEFYVPFEVGYCQINNSVKFAANPKTRMIVAYTSKGADFNQTGARNEIVKLIDGNNSVLAPTESQLPWGIERSMTHPACANYMEEGTLSTGLKWVGSDYLATCWNCRKEDATNICKAVPDKNSDDFEYGKALQQMAHSSPASSNYSFFTVDDDGCDQGGNFNIYGLTIGGGKANTDTNYLLGFVGFDLDSLDVATGGEGGCKMSKMESHRRQISAIDYRDPKISYLEYIAQIYMRTNPMSGSTSNPSYLDPAKYMAPYGYLGPKDSEGNAMKATQVFPYLSRDNRQASSDGDDVVSHMKANFTGQLTPLAEINVTVENQKAAKDGRVDFDAGSAQCLSRIISYIKVNDPAGYAMLPASMKVDENDISVDTVRGEGLVMTGLYIATKMDTTVKIDGDGNPTIQSSPGCFVGTTQLGFRKQYFVPAGKTGKDRDTYWDGCRANYGKAKADPGKTDDTKKIDWKSLTCDSDAAVSE